jgi:hypothetical protein
MERVYILDEHGKTQTMAPILTSDEDKELQLVLYNNLDLLPGDQIDPDAPCRWMLVKREMPVPGPSTGAGQWSIDFFLVDQKATPTFVECKRYRDTDSRRKVVGQVLEYAANGQHYWSSECIRSYAAKSAEENHTSLDQWFQQLV